jgi:hypothetical protein
MKIVTRFVCVLSLAACAAAPALAQEKKSAPPAAPQGMPPLPKPGPEHELLKAEEGVWDATVEAFMAPGAPPSISKGTETNTLGMGGLWLVTEFKSEFMNMPFQGHGVMGWDPAKKKYVGTWVDSMSTGLSIMENSYDPATKTMTGFMEGPDMEGKVTKIKSVTEFKGDTRVFSMYEPAAAGGKETLGMRITYTRRK